MLSEWSVECSADDPVLWCRGLIRRTARQSRFIDLREIRTISIIYLKPNSYPPLMHALRALNPLDRRSSRRSAMRWRSTVRSLTALRVNLDVSADEARPDSAATSISCGAERSLFASFHLQEQMLHRLNPARYSFGACLRDARLHSSPRDGRTLQAAGGLRDEPVCQSCRHDAQSAEANWASALDALWRCFAAKTLPCLKVPKISPRGLKRVLKKVRLLRA